MELDSSKGIKFQINKLQESTSGDGRGASLTINIGFDSHDSSYDYSYVIDEEATLDLLRAARTWCEAHADLTGPFTQDDFRLTQSFTEYDSAIDLDTP